MTPGKGLLMIKISKLASIKIQFSFNFENPRFFFIKSANFVCFCFTKYTKRKLIETAELIVPKIVEATYMTPGKVYGCSEFQKCVLYNCTGAYTRIYPMGGISQIKCVFFPEGKKLNS